MPVNRPGHFWRLRTHRAVYTGAIPRRIPLSAATNAPVAIDGDYIVAGAGVPLSPSSSQ
jgi:hypothetical protein